jgi:hypothetical protein
MLQTGSGNGLFSRLLAVRCSDQSVQRYVGRVPFRKHTAAHDALSVIPNGCPKVRPSHLKFHRLASGELRQSTARPRKAICKLALSENVGKRADLFRKFRIGVAHYAVADLGVLHQPEVLLLFPPIGLFPNQLDIETMMCRRIVVPRSR